MLSDRSRYRVAWLGIVLSATILVVGLITGSTQAGMAGAGILIGCLLLLFDPTRRHAENPPDWRLAVVLLGLLIVVEVAINVSPIGSSAQLVLSVGALGGFFIILMIEMLLSQMSGH